MPDTRYLFIVASSRPRVGKTLLARLLAEHLTLLGQERRLFDTDAADPQFAALFPDGTSIVDIEKVPDQMKLFDSLQYTPVISQVIDLSHRSFGKFFLLMRDFDYVAEARAAGLKTVIFYIPDGELESYEQGVAVRTRFRRAGFIPVKNAAIGVPSREILEDPSVLALTGPGPSVLLRPLTPIVGSALADVRLSLSDFMRRSMAREPFTPPPGQASLAYLSLEARIGITGWLQSAFNEIRRALRDLELQEQILAHDRFGA